MRSVAYRGNVNSLDGNPPYRDGECVALVQAVTSAGHTSTWKPGQRVKPRPIDARGDRAHTAGNPFFDCDNADQFYVVLR